MAGWAMTGWYTMGVGMETVPLLDWNFVENAAAEPISKLPAGPSLRELAAGSDNLFGHPSCTHINLPNHRLRAQYRKRLIKNRMQDIPFGRVLPCFRGRRVNPGDGFQRLRWRSMTNELRYRAARMEYLAGNVGCDAWHHRRWRFLRFHSLPDGGVLPRLRMNGEVKQNQDRAGTNEQQTGNSIRHLKWPLERTWWVDTGTRTQSPYQARLVCKRCRFPGLFWEKGFASVAITQQGDLPNPRPFTFANIANQDGMRLANAVGPTRGPADCRVPTPPLGKTNPSPGANSHDSMLRSRDLTFRRELYDRRELPDTGAS